MSNVDIADSPFIDEDEVNEIGGWTETMQWLYLNNGLGIFDEELKLVRVEERDDETK